jgi:hypothetical protein
MPWFWRILLLSPSIPERNHERGAMTPGEEAQRKAILLARLAESRTEIKRILEPRSDEAGGEGADDGTGFPRSRTMRALMSGRGLGAVGATAAGLLMARPALAWRLIRMLPTGALLRMGLARFLGGMQGRRSKP